MPAEDRLPFREKYKFKVQIKVQSQSTVVERRLAPLKRRLAPLLGCLQMADMAENGWVRKQPLFGKL